MLKISQRIAASQQAASFYTFPLLTNNRPFSLQTGNDFNTFVFHSYLLQIDVGSFHFIIIFFYTSG